MNDQYTNVSQLAEDADVPSSYIAKIMQTLVKVDIVQSTKGAHGGFKMNCHGKSVKLIDVVLAIDGNKVFTGCGLGLKQCSHKFPCPLHDSFKQVREDLKKMLTTITVHGLTKSLDKAGYKSLHELDLIRLS
jgi:Rrf2 family protein